MLGLVLSGVDELIKDFKIGGSLGWSDQILVEFVILRNIDLKKSKLRTLNFCRVTFQIFK